MRGLFIGRFQPFHNGHLAVLKEMVKENDSIIIAVGSAQFSNTEKNPLTAGERLVIITHILRNLKVREFYIVPIEDVGNDNLWAFKLQQLLPQFDSVYTNNPLTKKILVRNGFKVKTPGLVKRSELSGTKIRERIKGGKSWRHLVPQIVINDLIDFGLVERITSVSNEFK